MYIHIIICDLICDNTAKQTKVSKCGYQIYVEIYIYAYTHIPSNMQ